MFVHPISAPYSSLVRNFPHRDVGERVWPAPTCTKISADTSWELWCGSPKLQQRLALPSTDLSNLSAVLFTYLLILATVSASCIGITLKRPTRESSLQPDSFWDNALTLLQGVFILLPSSVGLCFCVWWDLHFVFLVFYLRGWGAQRLLLTLYWIIIPGVWGIIWDAGNYTQPATYKTSALPAVVSLQPLLKDFWLARG